jgi:hypothetical protein
MGVYDLPATIDHVLAVSNQRSLYYVGHSMGSSMFFVLTSTLPHYNSKIRIMFGFGPAAFNSHIRNNVFRIAACSRVGVSCNILIKNKLLLLFIPLSLRTEHGASTVPRHPRFLFQFLGSIRHLVGLLGGGISPAQGLYLHRTTQHRETQTHIHALSRIRTCDPNVRAADDSTCLRPLGHWDRPLIIKINIKLSWQLSQNYLIVWGLANNWTVRILRLSRRWCFKSRSSGLWRRVVLR